MIPAPVGDAAIHAGSPGGAGAGVGVIVGAGVTFGGGLVLGALPRHIFYAAMVSRARSLFTL